MFGNLTHSVLRVTAKVLKLLSKEATDDDQRCSSGFEQREAINWYGITDETYLVSSRCQLENCSAIATDVTATVCGSVEVPLGVPEEYFCSGECPVGAACEAM